MPQERAQFVPELQDTGCEELAEIAAQVGEARSVCHGLETFDREHEIVGCFLSPALESGWPVKSVKGRVDLERGELTRCKLEYFALYEP